MKATRRAVYALLLTALGGLAACEQESGVEQLTAPAVQYSKNDKVKVEFLRRANSLSGDVTYVTHAPIGKKGAVLNFAGHSLVVQQNSVKGPTYFSATLRGGSELRVDLRAWEPNGTEVTSFARPVQIQLNISDVINADGVVNLAIYYHNPAGGLDRMPSFVDLAAKTLSANLPHFSDYSGGFPRGEDPNGGL